MVCGVCPAHSDAAVDCREAALGLARHVLQVDQRHHALRGILQTILCHSSQGGREGEGGREERKEGGREGEDGSTDNVSSRNTCTLMT